MAVFGRLDIHFPDGRSASYNLSGAIVSVGSGEDNAIRIEEAAVSPHHFRLEHQAGRVHITDLDSEYGTVVDGMRLPANSKVALRAAEMIHIGELRLMYYQQNDSPTELMHAVSEHTQPSRIGFIARLDRDSIDVWPASSASAEISIENLTEVHARFSIETNGLPDDWITPRVLTFPVAGYDRSEILIQIKPKRRTDIPPGQYPLTITLTRLDDSEQSTQLLLRVQLGAFGGLSLALDPPVLSDGGEFGFNLLNHGNDELPLRLSADGNSRQLDIQLEQSRIQLAAGQRTRIGGQVKMRRRPAVGSPANIQFALKAVADTPCAYQAALPAPLIVKPYLSYKQLLAALTLVTLIMLVLAALLFRPPEPEISSFSISAAEVARGTPVTLRWEASHAERYVIEVNRMAVAELPGDSKNFTLDTDGFVDPIDIALIAIQGEINVIASQGLDVYQPVIVDHFETDRTAMLRNITGRLKIVWHVEGALSLSISQPPDFEILSEFRPDNAPGEIILRGAPADAFSIVLAAEDEHGNLTEARIDIAIREPECTPLEDAALFFGPNSRFARVSIAVQNVPVLANGITAGGEWLQVEQASGARGWAPTAIFYCLGFDPRALTVISDLPTLPTPTVTPSPSPTATPTPTASATVTASPSAEPTATSTAEATATLP